MKQNATTVAAIDLGATSGRVTTVTLDGNRLTLKEICRFETPTVRIGERMYTDTLHLYENIVQGLRQARQEAGALSGAGIDTWGVDFALLDEGGEMAGPTYFYRDTQTNGMMEKAAGILGERRLFRLTGVQDMWYNTAYQLMGIQSRKPEYLQRDMEFLTLSDLLCYLLTGQKSLEYTIASTTQMYSLADKAWSEEIIKALGFEHLHFPPVIGNGEVKGYVKEGLHVQPEPLPVIAVPQHDTASAACAVPSEEENYIFISSGTWSVLGQVQERPVINDAVYEAGFSNEGAAFGKVKMVKNIMGMWLIEELRREWKQRGKETSYAWLQEQAEQSKPFAHMLDVDDPSFVAPESMEKAICAYCKRTGQQIPESQGEFYRAVLESLAMQYRMAVEELDDLTGQHVNSLYLLGGAVQNSMFCRFAANATGLKVYAGPVESAALGNGIVQLMSLGKISGRQQAAELIKISYEPDVYEPQDVQCWDSEYEKYKNLIGKTPQNA